MRIPFIVISFARPSDFAVNFEAGTMPMKKFYLLISFLTFAILSYAQSRDSDSSNYAYWIDMMQDENANFFETQHAFELYWKDRKRDKGDGWKVFKRWEYFTSIRVDEFGIKPKPGNVLKEYIRYFDNNLKNSAVSDEDHWEEIGPVFLPSNGTGQPNGLGRVNCLAFHPTVASIMFAGSPAGGLWQTSNGGQTWQPRTDTLPTLGVSSIAVDYSNPDIIYIGTGDRDGGDAPGLGVWKSTDGGLTWFVSNNGMGNRVVGKMLMHPNDSSLLLAATNNGMYKTSNSGNAWTKTSSNSSHYKDLVFKPGDPTMVYATADGNFYRSTNTGDSWTRITSGIPSSNRLVIGVSPANSSYVYALLTYQRTFQGLYKSTNSGQSFTLQSNSPNIMDYSASGSGNSGQAWYDLCIIVDPQNVNTILAGGVNIFKSTNGGVSWSIAAHWTGSGGAPEIHADQHELVLSPNGKIYACNDGGVYYTSNVGNSWTDISSGLSIAQIYKIGQSAQSRNLVINGYQDNGTAVFDGSWRTEIGGDGMECIVDPYDSTRMYGSLYYGDVRRSTNYGISFSGGVMSSINETGEWVTPYILQEFTSNVMFTGFRNIWRSTNVTSTPVSFTRISNNLGGLNDQGIRVVENSPANNNILYFSREDNSFFRSENIMSASPTWTDLTSNLPNNNWPRDIECHPTNASVLWIVQANKVYQSTNKGGSWTNISGTLPNVSMNCIVYDSSSSGNLYVGSDLGVFFKGSWMTDWIPFNGGMPESAEITELEIYYGPNPLVSRLKAATYGRGLWSSRLYNKLNADLIADENKICIGQSVNFSDLSEGFYTSLKWQFTGGLPPVSSQSSPSVTYNQAGIFPVRLKIWNKFESDSAEFNAYITVDSLPNISVIPESDTINKGDSAVLSASGAQTYTWSPITGLNKFKGPVVVAKPVVSTTYTVTGSNTFCQSGGGSAQSAITVTYNGIDETDFMKGSIGLYPNPADWKLVVRIKDLSGTDLDLSIYESSGKVIYQKQIMPELEEYAFEFETTEFVNGNYLMKIGMAGYQKVIRFIVQHDR